MRDGLSCRNNFQAREAVLLRTIRFSAASHTTKPSPPLCLRSKKRFSARRN